MNFLCFRGNRVNIQAVPTDEVTRKSVHEFWRYSQVSFFDTYYINAWRAELLSFPVCQLRLWMAPNHLHFRVVLWFGLFLRLHQALCH